MRLSSLHIIVALLLAVLYMGERTMPCMEVCADECAGELRADLHAASDHQEGHDDGDSGSSDQTHHCGHCACPCHIPALSGQGDRFAPAQYSSIPYSTIISRLPSASIHPPDHIPLA